MNEVLKKKFYNVNESLDQLKYHLLVAECGLSTLIRITDTLDPDNDIASFLMPTDVKTLWGAETLISDYIIKVQECLKKTYEEISVLKNYLEEKDAEESGNLRINNQ